MIEIAKQIGFIVQSSNSLGLVTVIVLAAFAVVGMALLVVREAIRKDKN